MRIGIITVLYNSDRFLEQFIACLNSQTHLDFEVCFISNDHSPVQSREQIERSARFPFVFIENSDNRGVAAANNQGLDYFFARADCDVVHFLNNDVEFEPTFLSAQVEFLKREYVDGISPKMYYFDNKVIWYAGGRLSYIKSGVVHFGHNKRDKLVGQDLFRINYAPTCSLMIKSKILRKSGIRMMDILFAYYDDAEFCWQLRSRGIRLFYTPTVELYHKVSSSTGGAKSEFGRYYMTRNKYYMMRRHYNVLFLFSPLILIMHALLGHRIEVCAITDSLSL